jgi:hypothetical protein
MPSDPWPGRNWSPDRPDILTLLRESPIEAVELLPSGSNYVFAVRLDGGAVGAGIGIYKPRKGEAPLWDYPSGTLYRREAAAYLVSEMLGWRIVPPTVVREGPHGIGTVQLFIEHDPRANFFTFRDELIEPLQRMAAFDVLVNNGDRKGGHCLLGIDGRLWGIDHGLTFHVHDKLRTVIWDYAGEPLPDAIVADLERFRLCLERGEEVLARLGKLIARDEISALQKRLEKLLKERRYPQPGFRRAVPWPPV